MTPRLSELRKKIRREVPFVDVKPYSHNIISLLLHQIDKEFGREEANRAIDNFNLEALGWRTEQ